MSLPHRFSSVLRAIAATAWGATVFAGVAAPLVANGDAPLGDRLVIGVNNVPYSQRQVESYILVKESLRKTSDGTSRVIDARSWKDALQVFGEDMIVLQEAERLGSYQNEGALVEKFRAVFRQKATAGSALAAAQSRLGIDEASVKKTLESVLRVVAFRKAKDRGSDDAKAGQKSKWLTELTDRAVVRFYQDAESYVVIEPALGLAPSPGNPAGG